MLRLLLIAACLVVFVNGQYEGESCDVGEETGVCTLFRDCQTAKDEYFNQRVMPKHCSWSGNLQVVCCLDGTTNRGQRQRITTSRPTSTTEYEPIIPTYDDDEEQNACGNLAPNITKPRNGRKAWDKCIEYQETLVYPCGKSMALTGGLTRQNLCHHSTDALIVGGEDAAEMEFPHMVLLGYLNTASASRTEQWECAGTIISERYVLTAAHCSSHRDYGEVRFIRAGALKRSSVPQEQQIYGVEKFIKHPQYASPNKYHDIGLLKTKRPMQLDSTMVPACLDLNRGVDYNMALVTGWGNTRQGGYTSDTLQKVILNEFTAKQCRVWYRKNSVRNMEEGYKDEWQMCYGDSALLEALRNKSHKPVDYKDACQGDSGGPIQARNSELSCMYTVIGITSFGKGCGNAPGIYTRVSFYVPWIESVVWPADALDAK